MKMLGRIALVIAIIACVAALVFANKLGKIRADLDVDKTNLTNDKTKLTADLAKTTSDLKTTTATLVSTREELTTVNGNLDATKVKLAEANKDLETTKQSLADKSHDLDQAKTDLSSAQEALKQIKEVTESDDFKNIKQIKEKLTLEGEENKILGEQMVAMREENDALKQRVTELSTTPVNLRGTVAAVQDNWGFVVLDVGRNHQVQTNTDFLVYRDTKLVAKVEVRTVGQTTSVAEVLPEFERSKPRVGDLVVH